MSRHFTRASDEFIASTTAAGLAGFVFTWGTMAVAFQVASVSGSAHTLCKVYGGTRAADMYVGNPEINYFTGTTADTVSNGFGLTVVANTPMIGVVAKAAGSATPRHSLYNFPTATWTHVNGDSVQDDSDSTSWITGAYQHDFASADQLDGEIWAIGVWPKIAMTDSEVERLAAGDWLRYQPAFYEQASDGHEVGDMARTLGRHRVSQTSRTGTTRGAVKPPPGFRMCVQRRRS